MIKMIVAIGPNNLIGIGNKMPWHVKEEFVFFKEMTMGHSLLFGQTTFLGLPNKLPGRKHYVLGKDSTTNADVSITSQKELEQLFLYYEKSEDILFIAGGKSIYEQFYTKASEIFVSEIDTNAKGDIFLKLDLSYYKKNLYKKSDKFNVFLYKK